MKRFIAVLLCVAMALSAVVFTTFATETPTVRARSNATGDLKAGDQVTYTISVENNPGVAYLQFRYDFDKTAFKLIKGTGKNPIDENNEQAIADGGTAQLLYTPYANDLAYNVNKGQTGIVPADRDLKVSWYSLYGCAVDGDFCTVTFEVLPDAEAKDYTFTATVTEADDGIPKPITDTFVSIPTTVTVAASTPDTGDTSDSESSSTPVVEPDEIKLSTSADVASAKVGDKVNVTYSIENSPVFVHAGIKLTFDTSVLEATGISGIVSGGVASTLENQSAIIVSWDNTKSATAFEDGAIFTVEFTVKNTAIAADTSIGSTLVNCISDTGDDVTDDDVTIESALLTITDTHAAHDYVENVVAPTCTSKGYTEMKCSVCGYSYKVEGSDTEMLPHEEKSVTVEPTCEKDGRETVYCTVCSRTLKTTTIKATGHNYSEETVAPTCVLKGYTLHTCANKNCETPTYQDNLVDALGHVFDEGTVTQQPGGTTPGIKTYKCTRCDYSYNEEIPALGSMLGDVNNDGKFNAKDVSRYLQYLAEWDVEFLSINANVNGDDRLNSRDVTWMLKKLAGWDITFIEPAKAD